MTATAQQDEDHLHTPYQIPLTVDRDGPVPLYYQVAQQLTAAIEAGVMKPGDLFEKEMSLAERLGISRPTVSRSIAELVSKGLLVRRRGVGTTVAQAAVHRRNELTRLCDDLAEDWRCPSTRVLRLSYAEYDKRAARALEIDPKRPLIYLERLRMIGGSPIAILKSWLPPAMSGISAPELESCGLYELLRRRGVIPAVAHQTVGGRQAQLGERTLLKLGRLEPVLTLTRRVYDSSGRPVEFGDHCYRADRYKFDVTVYAL